MFKYDYNKSNNNSFIDVNETMRIKDTNDAKQFTCMG